MKSLRDFCAKVMSQLCFSALLCCAVFAYRATAAEQPVVRNSQVNAATTPFNTIQEAYSDPSTLSTDVIKCHAGLFGEALLFSSPLEIKLIGGYDVGFGSNPGITKVNNLKVNHGSVRIRQMALVPALCGNGVVESGELCDDGNKADNDGCSATCTIDSGFFCSGSPSVCLSVCGDGIVAVNEGCDDNNTVSSDGCSAACTVEPGYTCIGSPSVCALTVPGIAVITPGDAAVDVAVPAVIEVTFDSAMNNATLSAQGSAGSCTGSIQVSADDFATCIGLQATSLSLNAGGHTIATLTPAPGLSYGTTYKVRVTSGAQNPLGNGVSPYTMPAGFSIATPGDQCAPTVSVVISQIYGGGGNSGAVYRNDFIELHNNGTSPVSIEGWSVQYASAAGSSWQVTFLPAGATIPAGGYYLIQEASGAGGSTSLPTPDAFGSIPLAAGSGKVALVNNTTALSGTCPTGAAIVDFVGYGGASCFKGTAPTPVPSNTTAVIRNDLGCQNGGKNSTDFATAAPNPRNSAAIANVCSYTANECGTANEADFCNIQFPVSINVAAGGRSEAIHGQIYEVGVTEPSGTSPVITAQVGYGPVDVNPEYQGGWQWFPAAFSTQAGNNDEYTGTITAPSSAGTYRYTYRFSLDGGSHWTYCDLNGAGSNPGLMFEVTQLPTVTVH